jgi:hypothetical protein
LLVVLDNAKNKPAVLKQIYHLCFGGWGNEEPSFGYLAKVANLVGGEGRLAEIMWQLSTKPPTGDALAYIQAWHKAKARRVKKEEPAPIGGGERWG